MRPSTVRIVYIRRYLINGRLGSARGQVALRPAGVVEQSVQPALCRPSERLLWSASASAAGTPASPAPAPHFFPRRTLLRRPRHDADPPTPRGRDSTDDDRRPDAGAYTVAVEREDAPSNQSLRDRHGRSASALSLNLGSLATMTRADERPSFGVAVGGLRVPVLGGVGERDAGRVVLCGVAVTDDASDNDGAIACMESAGLTEQPE
jgi:uncharacterized protein GlcG (DUF336 family)